MVRTQIQLTEAQARGLRELAAARGVSMAQLVRRAVDEMLRSGGLPDREKARARALEAIGAFASDVHDLGRQHDRYFVESVTD